MRLVIVESPAKARTIGKYLGKEYVVRASVGHIRDLPKSNKNALDIEGGFVPHYEISKWKEKIIHELEALTKKADNVYLATDPDREGEAISYHLAEVLGLKKPQRVVFHEITEEAVKEAFEHPRKIDVKLVKAQEARRVLDRLVGYDLSGLVWKKVRYGLSAGRVQSPALRILMEREREIKAFMPQEFWIITAQTETKNGEKIIFTFKDNPKSEAEAKKILAEANKAKWTVANVTEEEGKRNAKPPFITSTLQQVASTRLGFSPSNTMRIAQKLYEDGHISYMRTDSTNLSAQAMSAIENFVNKNYGPEYSAPTVYKSRSKNTQEAHEAIRPTHFDLTSPKLRKANRLDGNADKLYGLIWDRTVASQMSAARILKTRIVAGLAVTPPRGGTITGEAVSGFEALGSRVTFDGWLRADPMARGEDVELPKVSAGNPLELLGASGERKETEPPNRFTEAGLIKELEKRGIGRPSTYASTIKTVVDRGYVNKDGRTLFPTDTGDVVSSFLEINFADIVSDTFTAKMEDELDEIARGEREYVKTLKDFYGPFTKLVKSKDKSIGKLTTLGEADQQWKCPLCGNKMVIKLGRSGRFMSCERFPDCSGSRTLGGEEMKGPQATGEKCPKCTDGDLVERQSRFGSFIACSKYPKCKFAKENEETKKRANTGVPCPTCSNGVMNQKRGRFGFFYSCSNYPDCKFNMKSKPTGKICELCKNLMMEGTKTISERCSSKSCPNHNPQKLKQES